LASHARDVLSSLLHNDTFSTASHNQLTKSHQGTQELLVPKLVKKFPSFEGTGFYYRDKMFPAFIPILSQMNPDHALKNHF
jgi:hypothetical protein